MLTNQPLRMRIVVKRAQRFASKQKACASQALGKKTCLTRPGLL